MRATRSGFTMIEMVMVMAVIAILALMMGPPIFDRTVRSQVVEGMALANVAKTGVAAYYAATSEAPTDNAAAGVPVKDLIVGNYVSSVEVVNGAVTITFGNSVNSVIKGKHLTLRPAGVKEAPTVPLAWLCNAAATPKGMTAMGVNRTDIPGKWLPLDCRSGLS